MMITVGSSFTLSEPSNRSHFSLPSPFSLSFLTLPPLTHSSSSHSLLRFFPNKRLSKCLSFPPLLSYETVYSAKREREGKRQFKRKDGHSWIISHKFSPFLFFLSLLFSLLFFLFFSRMSSCSLSFSSLSKFLIFFKKSFPFSLSWIVKTNDVSLGMDILSC